MTSHHRLWSGGLNQKFTNRKKNLPFHRFLFFKTCVDPLPQPPNRHRRRRCVDVDDVGKPTSTMSILRFLHKPEGGCYTEEDEGVHLQRSQK